MLNLNGKSILITGGAGSFGRIFTRAIFDKYPNVKKVVIFSRDEQKHYQMAIEFSDSKYDNIVYTIGDVRDFSRLNRVFKGVDIVIHAAAMKHVHIAEQNPMECVKTNILGAENVIEASLNNDVKKVIALSSDKASAPISLYGATKLASDKLFVAANNNKGESGITFSVVRYGNVLGASGSVVPFFFKKKKDGELPVTDLRMTRFTISAEESCKMIFCALENALGGEIFVPKCSSFRITDLATAIAPECEQKVVGIRPGEKLHEEMITSSESGLAYDVGDYFVLVPNSPHFKIKEFILRFKAKKVKEGFSYLSRENDQWETIESLKGLISRHI